MSPRRSRRQYRVLVQAAILSLILADASSAQEHHPAKYGMAKAVTAVGRTPAQPASILLCRVEQQEKQVELHSPHSVFRLDITSGLRAVSWENRLTGHTLSLGNGLELEFDIGLPDGPLETPRLEVSEVEVKAQGETGEAVFHLSAKEPAATALVTYRWDAERPELHKFITITNDSSRPWNRLLNVRLGRYDMGDAQVVDKPAGGTYSVPAPREFPSAGGTHVERGFPVFAADEFFFTLAHPGGVAEGFGGKVSLRQYPGAKLAPGKTFECMEAVYGVAKAAEASKAFLAHVRSRTRRVVRGHDKPYAIFEPFGARPNGSFDETEEFVLDSIAKVAEGQRDAGCHFDLYSVDFWVDHRGTLKECDPERFPNGLIRIRRELDKLGTALGLWIDGSMLGWSIGGNPDPAVQVCLNHDPQKPETLTQVQLRRKAFCRATEPIRSMYTEAFRYHIRQHGVRLLKFDNTGCVCANPNHEHLPGLYSTEPIEDALIDFFQELDAECSDVFLMLYWGYKSPWWLLHADTLFDSGIGIEAASPSDQPTPYVRDGVTQKLDQAQWVANENVPALGKDSLGVWLSDWPWNSQIGKERWEAGFVMDICRGSLLAQPWSDTPWLSPPERKQMAEFIALLKARPDCFGNSRFILGDPRKDEPYGYCCTDGKRAFLAIHNCCWQDSVLRLELNSAWGLPDGEAWDLYRWYPDPAKLSHEEETFGNTASIALRPFEIILLEAVPHGQAPTLDRTFDVKPIPTKFAEPSQRVDVTADTTRDEPESDSPDLWIPLDPASFVSSGGATLTKQKDGSILAGGDNPSPDMYTITAKTNLTGITAIRLEALTHSSLPSGGPGRAVNGNFALTDFRLTAAPHTDKANGVSVGLHNPVADFSQDSYGGWPVAAAIDDDPKTGWSIDPQEGLRHVAVFETKKPVGFAGGTTLAFTLQQGDRGHNIGRLRLSVTTAKPPIPLPKGYGPRRLIVHGQAPASSSGGTLVICAEISKSDSPMAVRNVGSHFTAQAELSNRSTICQPVLGNATYPAPWQAWRIAIQPSPKPQPFGLAITTTLQGPELACRGHFLPD